MATLNLISKVDDRVEAFADDVALVAIEAELSAALLASAIVSRVLYYTPRPEFFDLVALKIRVWAAKNGLEVVDDRADLTSTFSVIAGGVTVVRVYKPLPEVVS